MSSRTGGDSTGTPPPRYVYRGIGLHGRNAPLSGTRRAGASPAADTTPLRGSAAAMAAASASGRRYPSLSRGGGGGGASAGGGGASASGGGGIGGISAYRFQGMSTRTPTRLGVGVGTRRATASSSDADATSSGSGGVGSQNPSGARSAGPAHMRRRRSHRAPVLRAGLRVAVNGASEGVIRFIGEVSYARGEMIGVEMDDAVGKNDGSVRGVKYFKCEPRHGLFVRPYDVDIVDVYARSKSGSFDDGSSATSDARSSASSAVLDDPDDAPAAAAPAPEADDIDEVRPQTLQFGSPEQRSAVAASTAAAVEGTAPPTSKLAASRRDSSDEDDERALGHGGASGAESGSADDHGILTGDDASEDLGPDVDPRYVDAPSDSEAAVFEERHGRFAARHRGSSEADASAVTGEDASASATESEGVGRRYSEVEVEGPVRADSPVSGEGEPREARNAEVADDAGASPSAHDDDGADYDDDDDGDGADAGGEGAPYDVDVDDGAADMSDGVGPGDADRSRVDYDEGGAHAGSGRADAVEDDGRRGAGEHDGGRYQEEYYGEEGDGPSSDDASQRQHQHQHQHQHQRRRQQREAAEDDDRYVPMSGEHADVDSLPMRGIGGEHSHLLGGVEGDTADAMGGANSARKRRGPDQDVYDAQDQDEFDAAQDDVDEDQRETFDITGDGRLLKTVLRAGTGGTPSSGARVVVHYEGRLLDGRHTVIDNSRWRDEPFSFRLGEWEVIRGWELGLATMRQGEKARLLCAPEYAYGDKGVPPEIPADASLSFDIELIAFENPSAMRRCCNLWTSLWPVIIVFALILTASYALYIQLSLPANDAIEQTIANRARMGAHATMEDGGVDVDADVDVDL